jgi:Pyruvate/2-oxoacid:ferredoxin oxidoreductase delta subunit
MRKTLLCLTMLMVFGSFHSGKGAEMPLTGLTRVEQPKPRKKSGSSTNKKRSSSKGSRSSKRSSSKVSCTYHGYQLYVGPKGGCYYIAGKSKEYVDRSYCAGCN